MKLPNKKQELVTLFNPRGRPVEVRPYEVDKLIGQGFKRIATNQDVRYNPIFDKAEKMNVQAPKLEEI